VYSFSKAAVANDHILNVEKNTTLFSYISRSQKSKGLMELSPQFQQGWFLLEALVENPFHSLLSLPQTGSILLCSLLETLQ
jgi:hypothetical protein